MVAKISSSPAIFNPGYLGELGRPGNAELRNLYVISQSLVSLEVFFRWGTKNELMEAVL